MSRTLHDIEAIRAKIDQKDKELYDLLIDRTDLVMQIGAAKKHISQENSENNISFRPAREAQIMRSLLEKESGHLPKSVLISIWREMIASYCALQADFSVCYWGDLEPDPVRDMVRYYFGHTVNVKRCMTVTAVLNMISEKKATIGILPSPDIANGNDANWWLNIAGETSISGVLPFVKSDPANKVYGTYYFLSQIAPEPTGEDIFVLNVSTVPEISRMTVVMFLRDMGYEARSLSISDDLDAGTRMHLIEVDGYVATEMINEFNTQFAKVSEGKVLSSRILGQFPAPYDLAPPVEEEDEDNVQETTKTLVAPF
ncbi:MAG: chorismate mutase [Pseudomonadota bacterium]